MKLKKLFGILLIAVILCAGGLIAACDKDKDNTETNYGISPTSAMFVEGTSSDLNFTLSIGEDTVTSLKQGENTVAEDHWTVENSVLIVKADWLKTLEVGSYQFTLKTSSGKEMKFTVVCYKSAKISPERAEYDWDNPSDVAFTLDLGGASLLGVKIGDTVLSATQYNFSGNSLTIKSDAVLNACLDGDNECYITTSVGNLEFTIYCYNSVVTAAFDAVAYKVQSTNDEDVVFTFDAVGMEYLIERYTGTEWGDLREEEVVYSPFAHTLTVSGNVLANEYAGIIRYRVSVRDDSDSVFYFAVGAYGKSGGAQIAKNSVEVMNDFDYLADGANFGGQNTAFGTPSVFYAGGATTEIISGENAIEGKSLKITSSYGTEVAWNIFCGVRFGAVVDTVYRVKMDLKFITASDARSPSLVFRLYDGTNDTSEMILDYNSSNDTYTRVANVDKRNTFTYNQQTGVLTVEVYVVPTVSDQHFRLTLANAGRATVILDNYSILKTGMPVSAEVTSADADYVLMDGGSLQTLLLYGDGITFTSVTCDGTALTADDYAIADQVVTFAENWLQTLSVGAHTVTFNYSYINDVYGRTQAAQVSVTITVYEIVLPEQKTVATQKQTSAKESLLYEITSGGYTFAAVSENGIEIDGSKYSYDVENGELLLKADYLNTLSVGLHSFTLTFTAEGQDDYTINFGASVYGDDITHVESTAGVINFNDYAVATNLSGIADNSIFGTYKSVEPTIEKDSVLGNSLGITESGGGVIVYRALSLNKNYVIRMVFRTENDESIKSLLWKYNAASGESDSINSNWIQNGVITTTKDMRSTIEKRADGAYVWTAYLGAMKAQSDLILYVVTAQKLTIGSVELFETTYVAISETAYNYADYTNTAHFVNTSSFEITDVTQNLYVAQHINAEARNGWSEFRVMSGNIELVSGTDYTLDGNALYINASYLSGLTLNETVTLTLQRGCKNIEGEILWQSATVKITVKETALPSVTQATQKQTAANELLLWNVSSGDYTLNAVSANGTDLDASKYTFDAANNEFTLDTDYLNTLSVGLHSFTLTFTAEGQNDYTINIGSSVYGDDITHVESTVGVINFNDYAVGTSLSGIIDGSALGSYFASLPSVVEDTVLGNSLAITLSGGGVIAFKALSLDKNYVIRMVFRTENDESIKSLLWKYNAMDGSGDSVDSSWIQNDVFTTTKDIRSTIEKRADGAYVWTAYLGAMKAQSDLILYVVTAQMLTIGSIELFETTYVAISETVYNYADYTNTAHFVNTSSFEITDVTQNLYVAQHINAEAHNGWSEFRVMSGNIELVSGTDYTLDGNALYINASYLSGLTLNETVTLTLQRGCKNIEGEILWQSATVTVTRTEA